MARSIYCVGKILLFLALFVGKVYKFEQDLKEIQGEESPCLKSDIKQAAVAAPLWISFHALSTLT